jgi:hypothetical protein
MKRGEEGEERDPGEMRDGWVDGLTFRILLVYIWVLDMGGDISMASVFSEKFSSAVTC